MKLLKWLIIGLSITAVLSGSLLWNRYQEYWHGEEEYAVVRQLANLEEQELSDALRESRLPEINEKELKGINSAYAAWLYLPDTSVNYPIVVASNNQEYLRKTFEGKRSSNGSLFFDSATKPFSSLNTVIHGHNMKSGKMFGELKKYLNEDFLKGHDKLYLFCNGKWKEYQLLSVYLTGNTDIEPYQVLFRSKADFYRYIADSVKKSKYPVSVQAGTNESNTLLTLSTCYGKREKLIVQWSE